MIGDDDARELILQAVTDCMCSIFRNHDISADDFKAEANALMLKWVTEHGSFGLDGIVEALDWWQDQATDTNAFPLSRN
jgi:hypothetical protein